MKIPLFDLDWTLIAKTREKNIHGDAFYYAFEKVYGINNAVKESIEGRIDNQIIIETLLPFLSEEYIKEKLPEATRVMSDYFEAHKEEGVYPVLPGVVELLEELKNNNIPTGLLTGNVEEIAWEKLKKAGIRKYFDFGAFGDRAYKREGLVEIARENAENFLGKKISIVDLVLLGDTPRDIMCAKETGTKIIAVATGSDPFEQLQKNNPDLLIHDFKSEGNKVIDFLNN